MTEQQSSRGARPGPDRDRAMHEPPTSWGRRLAWFVGLWFASVLVLGSVAMIIRRFLALG